MIPVTAAFWVMTTGLAVTTVLSSMCGGQPPPWYRSDIDERNAGHYGPAWAYVGDEPAVVFRPHDQGSDPVGSIYVIRADGTGLTLISPSVGNRMALDSDRIAYDTSPAVSPDGRRVAYATLRHSEKVATTTS